MLRTVVFDKDKHDRGNFDCGVQALNQFIIKQANQSARRSLTKTFVLTDSKNPSLIIGYYTLAYTTVLVPKEFLQLKNYPHPAPALKLTRMAIDKHYQGRRLGEEMLLEVIFKTAQTANSDNPAAIIGLFVDPKHQAVEFYKKYALIEAQIDQDVLLFLPIQSCVKLSNIEFD